MSDSPRPDPFAALFPPELERMPTAWRHLRIPAAPAAFGLRADEITGPPEQRFRRRTILAWDCQDRTRKSAGHDRLALIDKALPHARHDLMLSEVSASPKPTPDAVLPITARLLWRAALEFVRFVSQPATLRAFGLDGGHLSLALNCDPNTHDRESVQAAKQFHLHLLYWTREELQAIAAPQPLGATRDPRERRQLLDPLSFLGGPLLAAALRDLDLGALGARVLETDTAAIVRGERPPGCLIELPDWNVLGDPAFEPLMRAMHQRITQLSAWLCQAFVGHEEPPPPWRRHRLRPVAERVATLGELAHELGPALESELGSELGSGLGSGLGQALEHGAGHARVPSLPARLQEPLNQLGAALRDLSPATAARLRRASPALRQHCMCLNQPCYGANLYSPLPNDARAPIIASRPVYLLLSTKLFCGIGSAGLLPIGAVPSVRVLRAVGELSPEQWQARAAWQHAFACHLRKRLASQASVCILPPKQLRDFNTGWC